MNGKVPRKSIADSLEEDEDTRTLYEKCKSNTFCFLEKPNKKVALFYHVVNLIFIFGSIVISVLTTIDTFETNPSWQLFIFSYEIGLLVWFTAEYILRVWSCSIMSRYQGLFGRLRFMKTFYMCVDAFIIISTIVTAVLHVKSSYFTLLRTTRFLQVFRILRLDRQKGDLGMMFRVVYTHRKELITCYFVGFVILFAGAYIVYILEKGASGAMIDDMVMGMYWALITVTSVGYGDFSPVTWSGKMATGIFALVGCAFFALPAGILGSGFAIQVAKQKTQKKVFKIRNPAAVVIQTVWRNYAVRRHERRFHGTWKNLVPQIIGEAQWPGYYSCLPGINAICNAKTFDAFDVHPLNQDLSQKSKNISTDCTAVSYALHESSTPPDASPLTKKFSTFSFSSEGIERHRFTSLPRKSHSQKKAKKSKAVLEKQARYRSAIRFILRVKFWTSVKSFKSKRYPFIEMKDIREKSTQWHFERVSVLREISTTTISLRDELREMKLMMQREWHCTIPPCVHQDDNSSKNGHTKQNYSL